MKWIILFMSLICLANEGDSLTASTGGVIYYPYAYGGFTSDTQLPFYFADSRGARTFRFITNEIVCANQAVSGSRMVTNGSSGVYPGDATFRTTVLDALIASVSQPRFQTGLLDARPTRKYILTVMFGTNPDTNDPVVHAATVGSYCLARKSAGWSKIILGTLLSRTDGIIGTAHSTTFDTTYAQPYNTTIKDPSWQAAHGVDAIMDFASDSRIGGTGAAESAIYFLDNIHPTQVGADIMASIYATAINALIATL